MHSSSKQIAKAAPRHTLLHTHLHCRQHALGQRGIQGGRLLHCCLHTSTAGAHGRQLKVQSSRIQRGQSKSNNAWRVELKRAHNQQGCACLVGCTGRVQLPGAVHRVLCLLLNQAAIRGHRRCRQAGGQAVECMHTCMHTWLADHMFRHQGQQTATRQPARASEGHVSPCQATSNRSHSSPAPNGSARMSAFLRRHGQTRSKAASQLANDRRQLTGMQAAAPACMLALQSRPAGKQTARQSREGGGHPPASAPVLCDGAHPPLAPARGLLIIPIHLQQVHRT